MKKDIQISKKRKKKSETVIC